MNKKKPLKTQPVDLGEDVRQLRLLVEDLARRVPAAPRVEAVAPPVEVIDERDPKPVNYHVGDSGSTDELTEIVLELLSQRPMYFREIVEETGARANRIKGVIVRLQREGHRVIDLAPAGALKALWFVPSDEVLERLIRTATPRR